MAETANQPVNLTRNGVRQSADNVHCVNVIPPRRPLAAQVAVSLSATLGTSVT